MSRLQYVKRVSHYSLLRLLDMLQLKTKYYGTFTLIAVKCIFTLKSSVLSIVTGNAFLAVIYYDIS